MRSQMFNFLLTVSLFLIAFFADKLWDKDSLQGKNFLLVGIIIIAVQHWFLYQEQKKLPIFTGEITPANEQPADYIELKNELESDDKFLLLLGGDRIISGNKIDVISTESGHDYLSLRIESNKLFLNARVSNEGGDRILTVINNLFQADNQNAFYPRMIDNHSLSVNDIDGNEVFNVRFSNPRTIILTGRFFISECENPLLISDNGIKWNFSSGGSISSSKDTFKGFDSVFKIGHGLGKLSVFAVENC